jgi:hypothetical protein
MAREFWLMALEYQKKAAALDRGKCPEIGAPRSAERAETGLGIGVGPGGEL